MVIKVPKIRKIAVSSPESVRSIKPERTDSNPATEAPTSTPRDSEIKIEEFV